MSEFWKRKLRTYLSTFDLDKDGVISKDDWVGMAIRFAEFGETDKQKAEHLRTEMEKLWEHFMKKADVGNRNTLTVDDLTNSIGKQRYDPELMKAYSGTIHDIHDMLDLNRDGYLQEEEYERILFQVGVPDRSFVKEAFQAIDVNGDGKLSLEEFINAFLDFVFSDDEKSPYGHFFGPLVD